MRDGSGYPAVYSLCALATRSSSEQPDPALQRGHALINFGRQFNYTYDNLRRPTQKTVTESGATKTLEMMVYGDGLPNDQANNLRGRLYQSYDGAGVQTLSAYDFKGNPLVNVRQFATDYTQHPDWSTTVDLEDDGFFTITTYDAFNRVVNVYNPYSSSNISRM